MCWVGCIHSIYTKSTEAMEAKERQISKLVDFRYQQCQLLCNALLRSIFGSSTVLKSEENAHWERYTTHYIDRKTHILFHIIVVCIHNYLLSKNLTYAYMIFEYYSISCVNID